MALGDKDWIACCGSVKFAQEMASAGPFSSFQEAAGAAREIWFNKVDVNGWLEAFAAHPPIGETPISAQWSKGEQSIALATANDSTLQELYEWNVRYRQKFGFVFLIFASGRSTPEILVEMKRRYQNRPIVEFEVAAQEQMKITELRLSKLFSDEPTTKTKAGEDRVSIIGKHLMPARTRPPITTHILDVARGSPATGVDVCLEMWGDDRSRLSLHGQMMGLGFWNLLGRSVTDKDGRSGALMEMVGELSPGVYRIGFDTGKYNPEGFFPYVSIVFEVRESQKWEHFHVPLLLSPFSLSTYRGS